MKNLAKYIFLATLFLAILAQAARVGRVELVTADLARRAATVTWTWTDLTDEAVRLSLTRNGDDFPTADWHGTLFIGDGALGCAVDGVANAYNEMLFDVGRENVPTNGKYAVQIIATNVTGRVEEWVRGTLTVRANPAAEGMPASWSAYADIAQKVAPLIDARSILLDPANADTIWSAISNRTDELIQAVSPAPDFTTSNTALVATIEATAPAPGNYAAVSNAAMSAIQEHQSLANYYSKDATDQKITEATNGLVTAAITNGLASVANLSATAQYATNYTDAATNAVFSAMATTNDVRLTPVYSQTPTFSEWTFVDLPESVTITGLSLNRDGHWYLSYKKGNLNISKELPETNLYTTDFSVPITISGTSALIIATRTRTDIIGYVLGGQTNAVLVSVGITNGLVTASVTNGLASAADTTLTPVYSGNGREFSEWTFSGSDVQAGVVYSLSGPIQGLVSLFADNQFLSLIGAPGSGRVCLDFSGEVLRGQSVDIIATRTANHLIGYTLGAYTNDVLAASARLRFVDVAPIEIPQQVADRGVSFVDLRHGVETQNCAVVIGDGAVGALSAEDVLNAPSNKVLRSASVAIGGGAYAKTSGTTAQSVAIGWQSRATGQNSIAIGSAPTHPDERFIGESNAKSIGDSTEATAGQAIALGYSAKATGKMAVGVGDHARAMAEGAVQLGTGENTTANTLQFRGYQLLDAAGQIPTSRLAAAIASMTGGMLDGIERAVKPGNMAATANGLDMDTQGHPVIEPRLDGISEIEIQPDTNGVYAAGTEVTVEPPMGSRNFDIVVREIPQFVGVTNGVEYAIPPQNNFGLSFAELLEPRQVEAWCDPSIGYTNGLLVVLTNAPCIVKVREPSTNRLYCVVKPWSVAADL